MGWTQKGREAGGINNSDEGRETCFWKTKEPEQKTTAPERGTVFVSANRAWLLLVFFYTKPWEEEVIIKMFRNVKY